MTYIHALLCLQFNLAIPITFSICILFLLILPLFAATSDTGYLYTTKTLICMCI